MYHKWGALSSISLLVGCGLVATPASTAQTVQASYVLAVNAELTYIQAAKPSVATLAKIKGCDNTAYAVVKPVADAVAAGNTATSVAVTAAAQAIINMQSCLAPLGVKF